MLKGFTRSEQRVLIFFVIVVTIGLGIGFYGKTQRRTSLRIDAGSSEKIQATTRFAGAQMQTRKNPADSSVSVVQAHDETGNININTADIEELKELALIGVNKAESIIQYRQQHGPFKSIDEIKLVSGIGEGIFRKNEDKITVGEEIAEKEKANRGLDEKNRTRPTSTPSSQKVVAVERALKESLININTASKQQLESLNGIGPKIAERIIQYRQEQGAFTTVEELQEVKGIEKKNFEPLRSFITIKPSQ